jgi:hypothetical protein
VRFLFLAARRRAMASGDRGAVCKMHELLIRLHHEGDLNITLLRIRSQLEREYRVSLDAPPDFLPTPTEAREEICFANLRDSMEDAEEAGVEAVDVPCNPGRVNEEGEHESDRETDDESESGDDEGGVPEHSEDEQAP